MELVFKSSQQSSSIPKIILQSSSKNQPQRVIDMIMRHCEGWTYRHFVDEEILAYFSENPLEEFPLISQKFNDTKKGAHKSDLFRYFFLYINGGFHIDSDAMILTSIERVVRDYDFVTVKSAADNDSVFQGLLGSAPKNKIIYESLKYSYDNVDLINNDYFLNCKIMYKNINECVHDFKTHMYIEDMSESNYRANTIDEFNNKLFTHYFITREIPQKITKPTCVENTKIGISFDPPDIDLNMFSNGIKQNTIFFYDLLKNIGYDAYLIVTDEKYARMQISNFWNKCNYKNMKLSQTIHSNFHLVIQFGFQINTYLLEALHQSGTKTVFYNCGNKYLIESELCLFKPTKTMEFQFNDFKEYHFDQIWLIPQMTNTCFHYMKTLYRSDVIEVPFIWSPSIINDYESEYYKQHSTKLAYVNKGASKKIAIFEPNLSIMKWALPSILIAENAYRTITNKELVKHLFVTNIGSQESTVDSSPDTFNIAVFNKIVKSLDLFVDKKMSIESRYVSIFFMSKHADIAVSHQTENPLNYLYLDLAWMGWPIVHNASLCKDVGYYYEGYNYDAGAEMVKNAVLTHDDNVEEYTKRNRAVINRYLPTNKYLQEQYKTLINQLLTNY